MAIKTLNNIASSNSLISIFLVFKVYFYILKFDSFIPIITQYIVVINNIIEEMQKVKAKK